MIDISKIVLAICFLLFIGFLIDLNSVSNIGTKIQLFNWHDESKLRNNVYTKCNNDASYDITIISQTSTIRLFYFNYLLKRWRGSYSITVYLTENETNLNAYPIINNQRITYELYKSNSSIYPINLLRNIAIQKVKTTHFFVCDMDFWPSSNLYESFMSLPLHIRRDDWLAIIVPGFQYLEDTTNDTDFQKCVERVATKIPKTKVELKKCIQSGKCDRFRAKTNTHSYHYDGWMDEPETKSVTMIQSFKYKVQEPYLIVQKTDHLPLFSELFYNYGRNKVEWVENIRYVGYKFSVLIQGFGVDVPHPPSDYQKEWISEYKKKGKLPFVDKYNDFVDELYRTIPDRSIVLVDNDPIKK